MPSSELKFRLTETTRLIKSALAAGLKIIRVTTDERGRPVLITDESAADSEQQNPLASRAVKAER